MGEEDQTDEETRVYHYEALGKYLELFEDDENMYRQFAVALLFKYTIRVLSELLGDVPDYLYRTGEDLREDPGWGAVESGRIQDQLADTVRLIEELWPGDTWPKNFMNRPGQFPFRVMRDLSLMASMHLEAVQQGALHVSRKVKEYKRSHGAEPETGPRRRVSRRIGRRDGQGYHQSAQRPSQ